MNIGSFFTRHATYRPGHTAFVFQDQRLTWRQFNQGINQAANLLSGLGIKKGDKVATLLPNCLELMELFWAVSKIGGVVTPTSTLLMGPAIAGLINDSGAVCVITSSQYVPLMESIREQIPKVRGNCFICIDDTGGAGWQDYAALKASASDAEPPDMGLGFDDPFDIMYSSGTTGLPKGIIHTHGVRAWYGATFASHMRMTPESVTMHAGAIVFNGAWVDLMPTMYLGATYVLEPAFEPRAYIETVRREKVTHVILVPAQIVALLNAPNFTYDNLKSLKMIMTLGAPLHMEHKKALTDLLPGRFYELYGLTEGFITVLDPYQYEIKPESVGVPPAFFEMQIRDDSGKSLPAGEVGEICGRGPILTPGYYNRPDLTEEAIKDGWLHSGDMGYMDEDGYLYLVDRKKDMIISGGVNVYPRDIEEVVVRHPEVQEAAVFGIPHERWGETPVAAVVLSEGAGQSEDGLMEWINQRVAAKFQRVSQVRIMEEFPRNVAGKTLKRVMRDEFGEV
jgi:long-chain acyl-CoA synthetase